MPGMAPLVQMLNETWACGESQAMLVSAGAIEPLTRLSQKWEGEGVGQGER
eukprot:gene11237-7991_t